MAKEINDGNFEEEVLNSDLLCVVDFWAPWCGPCKMLEPLISELTEEYKEKVKFVKLNVDENPVTAARYKIMSIPTLLFFKDKKIVDRIIGVYPKQEIAKRLDNFLKDENE